MYDDIEHIDAAYRRHMRKASNRLALCIARARQGVPTRSPIGLAWNCKPGRKEQSWGQDDIERLRQMRENGYKVREMAEAMHRSHESIKDGIRRHLRGFSRDGTNLREPAE